MRRGQGDTGGYAFRDSGDGQGGVWTDSKKAAEAARRKESQAEKAEEALADMEAKIQAIQTDESLSLHEKKRRLNLLTASGYSDAEFRLLREAQESE